MEAGVKPILRPVTPPPAPESAGALPWWALPAAAFIALVLAFQAYEPALGGPFLFDDHYLPFRLPAWSQMPLSAWMSSVRPMLMLSFWLNMRWLGPGPSGFHAVNVFLHAITAILAGLIARQLLIKIKTAPRLASGLGAFAAALFLLHPATTESVAYIAGRSDVLSTLLCYAAIAVFLRRGNSDIGLPYTLLILALVGAACLTKEYSVALPAVFLLADYYFNPGFSLEGIRKNSLLYQALLVLGLIAAFAVWKLLANADSAGFGLKDFTPVQYFFTQCRSIWIYTRLFVLPANQNADYDMPISRTPFEYGAALCLIALLVAVWLAWRYRNEFPLASFGLLFVLVMLAPTSSFVPIKDPLVERRMYLPMLGWILIAIDLIRVWNPPRAALTTLMASVLAVMSYATWTRASVWSNAELFWGDAVAKSPAKARPRMQLAHANFEANNCVASAKNYELASKLEKPDYRLLVDWALSADCAGDPARAMELLRQAAKLERTAHVYSQIGMVYAKQNRFAEALDAIETAEQIDPRYPIIYVYRGNIHLTQGEIDKAEKEYIKALEIAPDSELAQAGMNGVRRARRNRAQPPAK